MIRLLLALFALLLPNFSATGVSNNVIKMVKLLKKLKKIKESTKLRNLESSDEIDYESGSTVESMTVKNTNAKLHFLDINGFIPFYTSTTKSFIFQIFFYFLNMLRPKKLYVPLYVRYRGLRYLDDGIALNATCERVDGTETEVDIEGGFSQKFTCSSTVETSNIIASIGVDASKGVASEDDEGRALSVLDARDINFSNDAAKVSTNIEEANNVVNEVVLLQRGILVEDGKTTDSTFEIKGNLIRISNSTLDLNLNDTYSKSEGENKVVTCQINYGNKVNEKNYDVILDCDTNNEALTSDLYWKSGMSGTTKVILNMTYPSYRVTELPNNSTGGNRFNYRKSSSGLSGGAIAGIVIACVLVLIAVSIAALLFKKQNTPTFDNTTVSGLKNLDNL